MVVYLITNKVNGKQYVGQTIQSLLDRWKFHCSRSSGCLALKSAIQKYGADNFTIEIVCEAKTLEELNKKEEELISEYATLAPNGYNLKTGGNRPVYSEESRQKMSRSNTGRMPWNKGLTAATEPRIAAWIKTGKEHHSYGKPSPAKGYKHTAEEIEKQRVQLIGRKQPKEIVEKRAAHLRGVPLSEEHKRAISKGHKKDSIICNETGIVYESISVASKQLNLNPGHIQRVLKESLKHAKGYTFKYVGGGLSKKV